MSRPIITKTTAELGEAGARDLRCMLERAFDGRLAPEDWEHACGGVHFLGYAEGTPVSHVAVVPRRLIVGERVLRTGYVEAVATAAGSRRCGLATLLMRAANDLIRAEYELGALSTGLWPFYGRLGWERWRGPSFVRCGDAWRRTADEDAGIMILRTPATAELDTAQHICCEDRPGDAW